MEIYWIILAFIVFLYAAYKYNEERNQRRQNQQPDYLINPQENIENIIDESRLLYEIQIGDILNSYGEKPAEQFNFYIENIECAICMEIIEATSNIYNISCGHIYHKECLFSAIKNKCICPICREKIEKQSI